MPLTGVADYLDDLFPIQIDTSQIRAAGERPFLVTATIRAMPFHHVLGQVLYRTGRRCRLEGETLVILPPE